MLAADLLQGVAYGGEEVGIRVEDPALEIEGDHRLGLADGLDLPLEVSLLLHLLRDVGCELHDLEGFATAVQQRVIARLDPDLPAAFARALVAASLVLAGF